MGATEYQLDHRVAKLIWYPILYSLLICGYVLIVIFKVFTFGTSAHFRYQRYHLSSKENEEAEPLKGDRQKQETNNKLYNMVWSVHVEDNAGLGGALAQFPAGVSSSNPRYVTVSGYAPITLIEVGPKTVAQSWFVTVFNGHDKAFQLGYEGAGVVTLTFTAGGNVSIATGFGSAHTLTLKKLA